MSNIMARIILIVSVILLGVLVAVGAGVADEAKQSMQKGDLLGEQSVDQVRATASLQESTAQAATGQVNSHRLLVILVDEKTGAVINSGRVTVSVIDPDSETTIVPIPMQPMQDHFEATVNLNEPGNYRVMLQAVLQDDSSRQYEFAYDYH